MQLVSLPVDIPNGTILLGYHGSIAHNMYVPPEDPDAIDDIDIMGVVIGSRQHYLGLSEWGSRGTKDGFQGRYDCVFYELRKMVSLLLQGNPNVLGMLWLQPEHYLKTTPLGARLIQNRQLFVGQHVYASFAGYASSQLARMESRDPAELREYLHITAELKARGIHPNHKAEMFERPADLPQSYLEWGPLKLLARLKHYQKKGENLGYMGDKRKQLVLEHGYDSKNAAHLIRLLRMCKEFLADGILRVYRTADAAELLDIKQGKWPLEQIKQCAEDLFEEVKAAKTKSPLPEGPNRPGAEQLVIRLVSEHLFPGYASS